MARLDNVVHYSIAKADSKLGSSRALILSYSGTSVIITDTLGPVYGRPSIIMLVP